MEACGLRLPSAHPLFSWSQAGKARTEELIRSSR